MIVIKYTVQVTHSLNGHRVYMHANLVCDTFVHMKYTWVHAQRKTLMSWGTCMCFTMYTQQHLCITPVCVTRTSHVNRPLLALHSVSMKHLHKQLIPALISLGMLICMEVRKWVIILHQHGLKLKSSMSSHIFNKPYNPRYTSTMALYISSINYHASM